MISDVTSLEGAARAVAQALLNGLWHGVLLTAAVAVVLYLLRGTNAATRYAAWYATLLVVVALPLAAAFSSYRGSVPIYAEPHASSAAAAEPWALTGSGAEIRDEERGAPAASPGWRIEVPSGVWLVLLLGGGLLVGMTRVGRLVLGLRVLRRLKRTSRPLPSAWRAELEAVRTAHFRRPLSVRVSERITTPITVGFLHPAILLPAALLEKLSREELRQILVHELAHLRRRDDWMNLGQRLVEALFFFHPAVWWIGRRLDLEREIACDDYVVAAQAGERAYARCLTRLAELTISSRSGSLAPSAAPRSSHLAQRVRALLSPRRPASVRISLAGTAVLVALLLAGGATLTLAAPSLALVEATREGAETADLPVVEPAAIAAAAPDDPSAPVRTPQARAAQRESTTEVPARGPAVTAREETGRTPSAEAEREMDAAARQAGSPVAAIEVVASIQDELPLAPPLARLAPIEPTVARRDPASPPRSERRGVELEIRIGLPYGSTLGSPGRILPTPSALGLPTVYGQGRSGYPEGERAFPGSGGGIRLRVTGGGAPGNPYAAPWGRW